MPFTQKQLKQLVTRRHPMYASMKAHWDFLDSTYKGGREWFAPNIFQYFKEGDGEFRQRVKRAYRFNHTREVVDLVNKYLFRATITRRRNDAPPALVKFWNKATFQGLDVNEMMWAASSRSSVLGRPWLIVDNAAVEVGEQTAIADEDPEGSIYAYLVAPQQVLDLGYDEKGELLWILIEEYDRDDADPFTSSGAIETRWRLWTREEWYLFRKVKSDRIVVDKQSAHGLGLVPAVPVNNALSTDLWDCPALITDIAYLDRATANYASNLDAIIQDQTFSQLAMPAQNVMPGEDAYNKLLELGTKRVFLYDGESGDGPKYLSPDPSQAQLIIAAVQTLINEIYHSVGLAGERTKQDNSQGIDNSSGVAKARDFERVTALLRAKAEALESTENRLARVVCAWAGEDHPEEDLVVYPETFDVRGLGDEFYVAMQLSLIAVPEMIRGKHMKGLLDKLFPHLGKDERAQMEAEIDKWVKEMEEQKFAEQIATEGKSNLLEEGRRDRNRSGEKQSQSKGRETGETLDSRDQATGQGEK